MKTDCIRSEKGWLLANHTAHPTASAAPHQDLYLEPMASPVRKESLKWTALWVTYWEPHFSLTPGVSGESAKANHGESITIENGRVGELPQAVYRSWQMEFLPAMPK